MTEGRLFFIVGASDMSKDRLLAYARAHLDDNHPVMFAHRYTTRPIGLNGASHVGLSEAEFDLRRRLGLFVMTWEVAGLRYGIGTEINYWLAMGLSVVVNGSHAHIDRALNAYPEMTVVWVSDAPEGEASPPPEARRNPAVAASPCGYRMVHISNGGPLTVAGEKLVSVLAGQG
jgi:ribose 1,5-bisphosphokinase